MLEVAAAGLEQTVQEVITPGFKAWVGAHTTDILISCAALLAGYTASQHFKNLSEVKPDPQILGLVSAAVTALAMLWWLPSEYDMALRLKVSTMVGFPAPFLIAGMFMVINKFFPGKGDALKNGIYIHEDPPEEDRTLFKAATKYAGAAIVGKKKDKRAEHREKGSDRQSTKTEVWSQAKRDEITGRSKK